MLNDLRQAKLTDFVTVRRQRLSLLVLIGFFLTLCIAAADRFNALVYLEHSLYDMRCRWFQFYSPKPSEAVFHLDIDDECYDRIGRFPWDRAMMAEFVDEIRLAEPKVVMLDILYTEPEKDKATDADPTAISPGDSQLARAMEELGNVVLAVSLTTDKPEPLTLVQDAMIEEIFAKIQITKDELIKRLRDRGLLKGDNTKEVDIGFINARREAIRMRINEALQKQEEQNQPPLTLIEVQKLLLPDVSEYLTNLPEQIAIREELPAVLKARAMRRHGRSPPPGLANLFIAPSALFPIEKFTNSVNLAGFVDYLKGGDAVVRELPLFVNHKGKMFPAAGLATALKFLDIPLENLTFDGETVVIPVGEAEPIRLQTRTVNDSKAGVVPMVMNIPWFGSSDDKTMYDYPKFKEIKQRKSMMAVYNAREARRKLDQNYETIYQMASEVLHEWAGLPYKNDREYNRAIILNRPQPAPLTPEYYLWLLVKSDFFPTVEKPTDNRDGLIASLQRELRRRRIPLIRQQYESQIAAATTEAERAAIQAKLDKVLKYDGLINLFAEQVPQLKEELARTRADLAADIKGKAVFIGLTATGAVDIYPMPLFSTAPGVIVHGAVFNGIVSRLNWVNMPWWFTTLVILVVGAAITMAVTSLSPFTASTVSVGIAAVYFLINGLWLFDKNDLIAGLAGPMLVAAVVWATLTLLRYFLEMAERERLTRRFRSYVDPQLVNFVKDNPQVDVQAGQIREMSVVFTDLEGFTTISEVLRERTVAMLSDYMTEMVPLIRANSGFVNKFLGDGIMFFYNAPVKANSDHAFDAVRTIFELQKAMIPFNAKLKAQNLPPLNMRAGMTTGNMVVGDAGSQESADYTVLGDSVNLSARLEGANKITGTACLMVKRTVELLGDRVIFRPVANLQVKGKQQAVITYEPLCLKGEETPAITAVVNHSRAVYDAFVAGNFASCLAATEAMTAALGPTKFAKLYAEQAKHYLEEGTPENFDGRIALDSK